MNNVAGAIDDAMGAAESAFEMSPEQRRLYEENERRAGEAHRREAWSRVRNVITNVANEHAWALARDTHDDPELARVIAKIGEPWKRAPELARGRKVLVLGNAGAGKTTLLVHMLRPWFERAYDPQRNVDDQASVMFVDCFELAEARTQHGAGKGEPEVIRRAIGAELLILDELGQPIIEPARSPISEIIWARHAAGKWTWITSGLTLDELEKRYGAGFLRRVAERGRATVVHLGPKPAPPPGGRGIITGSPAPAYDPRKRQSGDDS